jgi:CRP-like cAMP-binding protein
VSAPATDYLVHFSNVLMLVAYSVRDILWLRWFAVAAAVSVIPYYLLQPSVLWPPVMWAVVFTALNLYQIARIYLERRPVTMSPDEQTLYDLAFQCIRPREFVSLALLGEWKIAAPGDRVLTEDEPVSRLCIAISGSVRVRSEGRDLGEIAPGNLIGTALALTGDPSPVEGTFTQPARYMVWPLDALRRFLDRRPDLRVTLQGLVNRDLAGKIGQLASAHPGSAPPL